MDLRHQLQRTLGDAYTLERELGGGGMSRVFVARETALNREVVVKVLPPELTAGVNVERFKREIQLAAALQHPHIVQVLSTGETNGVPYYTMPFVTGESLRARLARDGALPIGETISILREVAKALGYAHERGVVHRDIKPDNVLLSGGIAVVTDFGVAKALSNARGDAPSPTLTAVGTSLGTPAYMAPEQAAADPDTNHRADIYAFGVMVYEMLAGVPPFHGRTPQRLLAAQMGERPRPISELRPDAPRTLADLVMRCLEKDPDARPQSAADVVRVLDNVSSGGAGQDALPTTLLGARIRLWRALGLWAAAFVVVAIVAKASVIAIGLPDWVVPGALVVMVLGLPLILFTAFVHRATHIALTRTPTLTPGGTTVAHGTMATFAVKASPFVTWKRTVWGGAITLGLFVVLVAGYMILRALGIGPAGALFAKGSLNAQDRLIVADFGALAADSALGSVIAEALRTNLTQSTAIRVLSPSGLADALRRMQRPVTSRLDLPLAREVAEREGIKAIVSGDVTSAGTGFILTVRLTATNSSDELANFHEAAKDATDLIPAVDRITRALRGRIGESLKRVNESPALMQVTTASLPALRKYTEGMQLHYRDGQYAKAAAAFEEAIRLDSTFVVAFMRAGTSYTNAAANFERRDSLRVRAFRMRDRLPALERALVEGQYYGYVARRDSSIAAYERAIELDPNQSTVLNQLGNDYVGRREFARAESTYHRAIALNDGNFQPAVNLVSALVNEGKHAEAKAQIVAARQRFPMPGSLATLMTRDASMEFTQGHYDRAETLLDSARTLPRNSISRAAGNYLASFRTARGQLANAMRLRADQSASDLSAQVATRPEIARLALALDSVHTDNWIRERHTSSVQRLDELVKRFPKTGNDGIAPAQLLGIAREYAWASRPDRARAMLARYDRDVQDSVALRNTSVSRTWLTGEIAVAEHRYPEAITAIRAGHMLYDGRPHACSRCIDVVLARAFDLAGMADSSIAAFNRFLDTPYWDRFGTDADYLAGAYKRLGELYEAKNDREKAVVNYAKFVELWKNADPDLQPKVAEVERRLSRLRDTEKR